MRSMMFVDEREEFGAQFGFNHPARIIRDQLSWRASRQSRRYKGQKMSQGKAMQRA
jgi:hypothetical protein